LCDRCEETLRKNRPEPAFQFGAFAAVTAGLLLVDLALILSSRLWPDSMGLVTLIYGLVLLVPGLRILARLTGYGHAGDADWNIGRWPLMIALMGLACVLAYIPILLHRHVH
jgi:drug/metabolite transporter (DMT)-like permease